MYLLPCPGKKKKDGGGGFESAMEAAEQDVKKADTMKKYPGLCLPDNPEQAMKLLQPDSHDVRAAKDALSEVGETDRGIYTLCYTPTCTCMLWTVDCTKLACSNSR